MITVVTTYRDNFDLMELMVNYYKSYWKCNQFIFCIGLDKTPKKDVLKMLSKLDPSIPDEPIAKKGHEWYAGNLIDVVLYPHTPFNTAQEWNNKRNELISMVSPFVRNKNTALIDNDEFIYCPNPEAALKSNNIPLHYVEYVPKETFDFEQDWEFTNQPYYYRAIIKGFKEVSHNWCVLWKPKSYIKNGHVGDGNVCQDIKHGDTWDEIKDKNVVFHFGTLSRDFYKERKYWSQGTEHNTVNHKLQEEELDKIYTEQHLNCPYPKYVCNWLKSFLTETISDSYRKLEA